MLAIDIQGRMNALQAWNCPEIFHRMAVHSDAPSFNRFVTMNDHYKQWLDINPWAWHELIMNGIIPLWEVEEFIRRDLKYQEWLMSNDEAILQIHDLLMRLFIRTTFTFNLLPYMHRQPHAGYQMTNIRYPTLQGTPIEHLPIDIVFDFTQDGGYYLAGRYLNHFYKVNRIVMKFAPADSLPDEIFYFKPHWSNPIMKWSNLNMMMQWSSIDGEGMDIVDADFNSLGSNSTAEWFRPNFEVDVGRLRNVEYMRAMSAKYKEEYELSKMFKPTFMKGVDQVSSVN